MKLLLVYATTEGQTRKIAEFVAEQLRSAGDKVSLFDATAIPAAFDLMDFDATILAASVHAHHYQGSLIQFARAHRASLNAIPGLFLSVSLSAAGTDEKDLAGIASCAAAFKAETGWSAAEVHHVAGAFRFTKYDFFKGWIMRLIARDKKVKVTPGEDLELTDWDGLTALIRDFRERLADAVRKAG